MVQAALAVEEIAEAAAWYEAQRPGLGDEFLDDYESVLEIIMGNPRAYGYHASPIRKAHLKRFPYLVFYTFSALEITILSVFHTARNPAGHSFNQ